MSYDLPKPSLPVIILQSLILIAFAAGLFFVITDIQANRSFEVAIGSLKERNKQLDRASAHLNRYTKYIHGNPLYQKEMGEPTWEKVDETWVDLSYQELIMRLRALNRHDRPFVLDYFSASLQDINSPEVADNEAVAGSADTGALATSDTMLTFHLQGYFLCPCQ